MKVLLSSLLLSSLCALSSWSVSSDALVVTQSPDVTVMKGDTVIISCCWREETTQNVERIKVNWLKNHTRIGNKSISLNNQSVKKESDNCWKLTFSNITHDESGRYICTVTVEIPIYKVIEGYGTDIIVKETKNKGQEHNTDEGADKHSPMNNSTVAAVAVVVPLFFLTLVCFCLLRRKQVEAARVIYEVPHVDSEVADMDKHSTSSSRGSSQWCQVPVYESFDYFEHMPTKESG